jgi:hypothetical protein
MIDGFKSYVTFSKTDLADDDLVVEWILLAVRTVSATKRG